MAVVTEIKEIPSKVDFYIVEDINEGTYSSLRKDIDTKIRELEEIHVNNLKWYRNNDLDESLYKKEKVKIIIHLSTYGGSAYDGLGICDLLTNLDNNPLIDLEIICEGKVMSCGIPILLSVKNRICTENTNFMIHQLSTFNLGKLDKMKEDVEEGERLQNIIDNIIVSNSKITKEQLDDWYSHKKDAFFDAKKALELGVVNKVI